MVVSIFVIRGSYLTTLLLRIIQGAESLFSLQVVLRLSLSPAPLRTPSSVWITLGAGLHGRLNTEEHSGPPISQRERLTHNESSFICMSFIIIPIVSLSMGLLSVNFSMQHSGFSCILSIIPTVWQFPHNHTPLWLCTTSRGTLFTAAQGKVIQHRRPEWGAKVLTAMNHWNTDFRKMQIVHEIQFQQKKKSIET